MLKIRLFPKGRKNQPFFKIVVAPKENPPKGGRFVEEIGFVNPLTKEKKVDKERAKHWLSVGAQPSDTVYNLFIEENIIDGKKIPLHKKKKKSGEEEKEAKAKETPKEGVSAEGVALAEEKKEESSKEEAKQEEAPKKDSSQEESKPEEASQKEEPKQESAEEKKEEDKKSKKEQPQEQEKKE